MSLKKSCAVVEPWSPIFSSFGPISRPGAARSTTKAVIPFDPLSGAALAKMTKRSAMGAFVMKVFAPLMT